ncbi:MAG TPA: hypothetical protein VMR50_04900 [Myxococcota bacterium]|nr:hypothetical protein [Myxococcota bacterium]
MARKLPFLPFLVLVALFGTACGVGYKNGSQEQRPEIITGMGATVMYPGEAGPAMPGSAIGPAGSASSSSGSTVPGTTSGSSNSSGTGVPDNGGSGYGSHSGSSSSNGSGSGSGGSNPGGSNLTMIGQTTEEASNSTETKEFLPIGPLFGYPFWFLGQSLGDKADDAKKAQMEPKPAAAPPRTRTADDVERDRLERENEALRKELEQRASAPPVTGSSAPAPHAAIGDELAALERSLDRRGGTTTPPPVDAAAPARKPLLPQEPGLGAPEARDRNGDGKPDEWLYTVNGRPVTDALDDDFDGRVDRIQHYDSKGRLVSSDEDLNGDGVMETTSIYEDGQLVRRRTDSNGDGQADTWSFYKDNELLRTEIDKNGDGFRDEVTIYSHGKVEREEEDRNGDGRPDVVTLYRNGQIYEKREDLDFDGMPDVVSHYENGKLTSREASSSEAFEKWETEGGK